MLFIRVHTGLPVCKFFRVGFYSPGRQITGAFFHISHRSVFSAGTETFIRSVGVTKEILLRSIFFMLCYPPVEGGKHPRVYEQDQHYGAGGSY